MDPEVAARLAGLRFSADGGIVGSILKSGRAERVDDPARDARFYSEVDTRSRVTTRSILAVPLVARGESVEVIEAINHQDGPYRDDDLSLLESLAEVIAIALSNADRFAQSQSAQEVLRRQVGMLQRDLVGRDLDREIIGTRSRDGQGFAPDRKCSRIVAFGPDRG